VVARIFGHERIIIRCRIHSVLSIAGAREECPMIVEVRTYRVQPGCLELFVREMSATVPRLEELGIRVLATGGSMVDDDGEHAYLVRAFDSLDDRDRLEEEFYGSSYWNNGPRLRILSMIQHFHTVVVSTDDDTVWAGFLDRAAADTAS
jgi:hypothetical protein